MSKKINWYRFESSKFDKNKKWVKTPFNPDYIPPMKGKLTILKYKYKYDEEGKKISNSGKLVEIMQGYNKVVSWAKIPLSFLIAGYLWKFGKAWSGWDTNINTLGDGRTRGLDGSGLLKANRLFEIPNNSIKVKVSEENLQQVSYWYDDVNGEAAYPFFPTKIIFGLNPVISELPSEIAIAENQHRLYSQSSFSSEINMYETKIGTNTEENEIIGNYVNFQIDKKRMYVYASRPQIGNFSKDSLWFHTDDFSNMPLNIGLFKSGNYLSAMTMKFILPEHSIMEGGVSSPNYCYDGFSLGQAMLKCDAGSRNLIDATNINENTEDAYYMQLDGLAYAIKNFGNITKEANTKLVFIWTLYF